MTEDEHASGSCWSTTIVSSAPACACCSKPRPDLEVVDEAGDLSDAVFKARRHTPDLIVLDVMLPDGDGVESIGRLQAEAPLAKVLILSMEDSGHHVRRAFGNGANGYVLKDAAEDELVSAIREVAAGGRYLHPALGARMVQAQIEEQERAAVRPALRPRAGGAATPGAGAYQPGDRRPALHLGADRRDAPRAHHAEASASPRGPSSSATPSTRACSTAARLGLARNGPDARGTGTITRP